MPRFQFEGKTDEWISQVRRVKKNNKIRRDKDWRQLNSLKMRQNLKYTSRFSLLYSKNVIPSSSCKTFEKKSQIVLFNTTMRSILIAKLNSTQLLENSAHNITKNYVCTVCHNYNWCILDSTQDLNSRLEVQIQLQFGRSSKLGFN